MKQFKEYVKKNKSIITEYIDGFVKDNLDKFESIHHLGKDTVIRLADFAKKGKMLRGNLACLSYESFGHAMDNHIIPVAASMEYLQSGLLVHDDIMDGDPVRRGAPSIHMQYTRDAEVRQLDRSDTLGEAQGICAGDVALFMGFELISLSGFSPDMTVKMLQTCSRELSYVAIAQMGDVLHGIDSRLPKAEEILHLYIHKTGRYTFSLPLILGAIAAGQEGLVLQVLGDLGIALGTVFQLKDDELGIFGNEAELGKPVGSDIREGKKTLFYIYLFRNSPPEMRKRLSVIFGNRDAGEEDIEYVREAMTEMKIRGMVRDLMMKYADTAMQNAAKLSAMGMDAGGMLEELIEYSTKRKV